MGDLEQKCAVSGAEARSLESSEGRSTLFPSLWGQLPPDAPSCLEFPDSPWLGQPHTCPGIARSTCLFTQSPTVRVRAQTVPWRKDTQPAESGPLSVKVDVSGKTSFSVSHILRSRGLGPPLFFGVWDTIQPKIAMSLNSENRHIRGN